MTQSTSDISALSVAGLRRVLEPKSVAVVGASADPQKSGYIILRNLIEHRFLGKIWPINPNKTEIQGLRAFSSVMAVPGDIDVAFIAVQAALVPNVVRECVEKKVGFGVVISSGFKEIGLTGRDLESQIVSIAKKGGMRLIGGNTIGMVNASNHLIASMVPFQRWKDGGISIICQTGLFAGAAADWIMENRIMSLGKVIDLGNKCDLDESDFLEFLGNDQGTKVIGLYLEDIADLNRFASVSRKVSLKKPIIMVKGAQTKEGTVAAQAHTGAHPVDNEIIDEVLSRSGIVRAGNFGQLLDYLKAFEYQSLPAGNRIGMITLSGASGVLAVDECSRLGLSIAKLSDHTKNSIKAEIMPDWQPVDNPVDIWVGMGPLAEKAHSVTLRSLLQDESVDAVLAILLAVKPADHDVGRIFRECASYQPNKPILAAIAGGSLADRWFNELEQEDTKKIPSYIGPDSPERSLNALAAMYLYSQFLEKPQ